MTEAFHSRLRVLCSAVHMERDQLQFEPGLNISSDFCIDPFFVRLAGVVGEAERR